MGIEFWQILKMAHMTPHRIVGILGDTLRPDGLQTITRESIERLNQT